MAGNAPDTGGRGCSAELSMIGTRLVSGVSVAVAAVSVGGVALGGDQAPARQATPADDSDLSGDVEEDEGVHRRAERQGPSQQAQSLSARGRAREARGDLQTAVKDFEKACAIRDG
jgi:hypothetical protein